MGFWPEVPVVQGGTFLQKFYYVKHLCSIHNFQKVLKEGQVNATEFWPDPPEI